MKFVDRTNEMKRLEKSLNSGESELIVVFGRRRIGKSTLIRKVLSDMTDIYFQADETQTANQLLLLSKSISKVYPGFDRAAYPDWWALLESLNYRVTSQMTLCLDEFPYLVRSDNSLPSVIQKFWDTASPKFNLILCGSSQQSMYSDVLNEKSPLYGRAGCILKLQPIEIPYMQEAMSLDSAKEAVEQYAFWGGVPRYWDLCMKEDSFEAAVRQLLLSADGTLIDEPDRLLRDELRDLMLSRTLLSTIGSGVNRISEIAGRIGKSATDLAAPLRRLIDMGFVEREIPYGEDVRNNKRSLYRIKDAFMDAYYHFVAPNASLIAMGRDEAVWQVLQAGINSYVGQHWERLCRKAVSGGQIDGVWYDAASRWWGTVYDLETKNNRQIELDVVAMSLDKQHLFVGECKWTSAEDALRLEFELQRKAVALPFAKGVKYIHCALFLRESPSEVPEHTNVYFPNDVVGMLR